MASGIYAIVNKTNGKRYIGRAVDIEKRWHYHQWMLGANRHFNVHLQRAWNLGDEFEFAVIEECDRGNLNDREIFWIAHYKTTDDACGYNMCDGGGTTTGYHFSEETKKKMSEKRRGVKWTKEAIEKRTKTLKQHFEKDPELKRKFSEIGRNAIIKYAHPSNIGRKASAETRAKLSHSLKGKKKPKSQAEKLRARFSGEGSVTAKLKESDVIEIRLRFLNGERQCEIHRDYPQIITQTMYDIVRNRRWKSVPNTVEELMERKRQYECC